MLRPGGKIIDGDTELLLLTTADHLRDLEAGETESDDGGLVQEGLDGGERKQLGQLLQVVSLLISPLSSRILGLLLPPVTRP